MEKYSIDMKSSSEGINQDKYFNKVYSKHVDTYGKSGADKIRDNIIDIFTAAIAQVNDLNRNNNILLVGKVQSGKTSNLEMFTSLALDNGYNVVVIYGGYDSTLLMQTTNRFKKTFDIPNEPKYEDGFPVIFSSDDSKKLLTVDNEIVEDLLGVNKPIFIISMKRPAAMKKVNDLFNRININNIKAFIIDDEGDQASLNTKKNKEEDASATYAQIVDMKKILNDPLYLSVTATPQANVFLDNFSKLRPDSIRLIEPGEGYCGAERYHLFEDDIIEIVSGEEEEELENNLLPHSVKNAINHYIIASAIMKKRGLQSSEMIIHSHRKKDIHKTMYEYVNIYIQQFKDILEYEENETLKLKYVDLYDCYNKYFSKKIITEYPFESLKDYIKSVVTRIYVIMKNTDGKATQATEELRKYKIYIGGDLLQRGVTFPHLVTTYFTRWANDGGNMDTNLQRARWFGYRSKYIDICKIFTSEEISSEFTNLSEMEQDLWEQIYSIQDGKMTINDILIRADNSKQRPTRKNVVNYNKLAFKSKWIKQKKGIFDINQLMYNKKIVEKFIADNVWKSTSQGRNDGGETAKYILSDKESVLKLIKNQKGIFDFDPFELRALEDLMSTCESIPIILMNGFEKGRVRSFYSDNKIFALHQGPDSKEKEKINYKGDSYVIVDSEKVNIQIHKIIPKKRHISNNMPLKEYTQYMFAFYMPKEKIYFSRG